MSEWVRHVASDLGARNLLRAALGVLLVGGLLVSQSTASRGALPGPAQLRLFDPQQRNLACEGCHQDVAREWRGSQHQTAFTDPVFQAAFSHESTTFCRDCHAPEAARSGGDRERSALGVACVSCHVVGDAILAGPHGASAALAHPTLRNAEFGSSSACAGCHEFSFGDDPRRESPLGMQRTISEHAASPHADQSCADCHMPKAADGRRSHTFASTRDPEAHRRAVNVSVKRLDERRAQVELSLVGVGHAYPTGDLFRRLAIRAEVVGDDFQVLAEAERYLARHFSMGRDVDGRPLRVESHDDRLLPGASPRRIVLDLGPLAAGKPIAFRVALERVLHVADHQEERATLSDRVVLAQGQVLP